MLLPSGVSDIFIVGLPGVLGMSFIYNEWSTLSTPLAMLNDTSSGPVLPYCTL